MNKLRLRKCVGILTVLAALLLACPVAASPGAVISIEDGSADYGGTDTVSINITGVTDLGGVTIKLHYDNSVVEVDSVTDGDMGIITTGINNPGGVTLMTWFSAAGITDDFIFAYVELHAVGSGGETSLLELEVTKFGDTDRNPIAHTIDDGVFTVTPIPTELVADAGGPSGGPYSGIAGSPVSLSGSATGGTPPYTYDWDLDNKGPYETPGKDVAHTWTEAGDYIVGLRVTDSASATDTDTADVHISGAAVYYTLTVTCDPAAWGSVTLDPTQPGGGYVAGTPVELTAVANAGYSFDSWSGDLSGSANPDTITMDSSKTVTANFVEIPAGTTPVTGNVVEGLYIDVTPPSAIDLGDMLQGATTTGQSSTAGSVDTNATTWSVEAKDETNGGYMRLSDSTPLTNKLQIGKSEGVYADADVGISYANVTSLPFYVSQTVELSDVVATGYSITITFTGLL